MFLGSAVPSWIGVFPKPTVKGICYVAEVLHEATVYVTRAEERAELRDVFRERFVGNRGSVILRDRDSFQNQNVAEEVQDLSEELTFEDL